MINGINKLEKLIKDGEKEIYINLINCDMWGKTAVNMLEKAGYVADNMGPQRAYTKN